MLTDRVSNPGPLTYESGALIDLNDLADPIEDVSVDPAMDTQAMVPGV